MISRELLSAVTGRKNTQILDFINGNTNGNTLDYMCDLNGERYRRINIHELAHMVKEWILTFQSLPFEVTCVYPIAYRSKDDKPRYVSFNINYFYEDGKDVAGRSFQADTELEAIFKAGEWILKEIKDA